MAQINRKPFSFSRKAIYFDQDGSEKFIITKKSFSFKYIYFISADGKPIFKIFKNGGIKKNVYVESLIEPDAFMIQGNLWSSEYAFYKNAVEFAYVSRKILNIENSYRASIKEEEDHHLVLALVIVLDMIRHRRNN